MFWQATIPSMPASPFRRYDVTPRPTLMGAVPRDTDGDGLADTHNEVFYFFLGGKQKMPAEGKKKYKEGRVFGENVCRRWPA